MSLLGRVRPSFRQKSESSVCPLPMDPDSGRSSAIEETEPFSGAGCNVSPSRDGREDGEIRVRTPT